MSRWLLAMLAVAGCGRWGFEDRRAGPADATDAPDVDAADAALSVAPEFVQAVAFGSTASPMLTVSYGVPTAPGDLLIAAIDIVPASDAALTGVTDDAGDTFALIGPFDGAEGVRHYLAWAITAGGAIDVTSTVTAVPSNYYELRIHEYANTAPMAPLGLAVSSTGTANGTDVATVDITTLEPNELVFALVTFHGAGAPGTGYTLRSNYDGDITEDRLAATPGVYGATASPAASSWAITATAIRGR